MRFDEGVEEELLSAAAYYDALTPGTGERFLLEVTRLFDEIEMFPFAGFLVAPGLRKRVMPRFPYLVLYTTDAPGLMVIAVAHTSRREQYWMDRWDVREPVAAYVLQWAA